MSEVAERWGSRRAFIMAMTGAAVGLGNIWRFPYMTGENGGSAFLMLYVIFVLLLGLPVMMAEILVGRAGRRTPMQALSHLALENGHSRHWRLIGLMGAATVFFILSFYSVVSGWSFEYMFDALGGNFTGMSPAEIGGSFNTFLADPFKVIFNHTLFMLLTMSVVAAGIGSGLEKLNNLLMPLLYLLLFVLVGYGATTSGFTTALSWLFTPNPAAIDITVVLNAMGHAFFTLAIGACALMAYGAYMPDRQSLPTAVIAVACLDILVALLSGIAIFSIVFSQGMDPASGPGLMFVTLPIALADLPGGNIWLGGFFLLLAMATWTSSINLAEPMVAMLQSAGLKRGVAALLIGVGVWLMGLPSALSFSSLADWTPLEGKTFFDLVTSIPTDIFLPLGGVLIAIFATWIMDRQRAFDALGASTTLCRGWLWVTRWISIPLVIIVLISSLWHQG
ncbi:sodium-dependent transporter [Larsenimonas rhizosphaerae]|uniref:Sodium-dependent transporter n=1 Tax=Larsenimonas rhizosphaerae TaxID=2944682 RepID=A0AA42CXI1_9GAMM|nr:sodium-dependent transporter [Larsenimonas rhizosphaerae]MCX2523898.1 sodium-dependent transporter [Larsenimonas rhizosphaerae]